MPTPDPPRSRHQRSMAANAAMNLAGLVAPALAAAIAMPILFSRLGAERLGVLSLAWTAVGAFTLLDFGLGRSLTREVATKLAQGAADIRPMVHASLVTLLGLGAAAGVVLVVSAALIVRVLHVPAALSAEALGAVMWVAAAVPFMTVSSGARGVLEAHGRFDLANLVRVPLGVLTYLAPVAVLPMSHSVAAAAASLAVVRAAAGVSWVVLSLSIVDRVTTGPMQWIHFKDVVAAGAWMTVANLAGALLTYVDRLVLAATVPLAALAFYAMPQELIGKLTVVPVALSGVLFPALSNASARSASEVARLFNGGLAYTYLLVFPVVLIGSALAPEWLALWLGHDFAMAAPRVVMWLSVAVLLQSLAITPLNLLQAVGNAALTARLQMLQVPFFVGILWWAARGWGIEGAACVWAVRMLADLSLLLGSSSLRVAAVRGVVAGWWPRVGLSVAGVLVASAPASWQIRMAAVAIGLALFVWRIPALVGADGRGWRQLVAQVMGANRRTSV